MAVNNTTRVKDKGYVSPDDLIAYLMSKGVSQNHALGIAANVKHESNFNPNTMGDRGTSAGLFQYHKTRKDNLMSFIGGDLSNWQKQVDFMLTEGITQKYLNQDFETPEKASYWFTYNWERPQSRETSSVKRQEWIASYKGGQYSSGTYNPNGVEGGNLKNYNMMTSYEAEGLTEPNIMGGQNEMVKEADLEALVSKEINKIKEKEKKEEESIARKKLEQLKVEKKKAMVESAFNLAIDAINESNQKPKRNTQIENIGLYQGVNIPIQSGLPTLPTLSQFENGGVTGDDDPPVETEKEREKRYVNELLYQLQGYYSHLDRTTGRRVDPQSTAVSFDDEHVYKKLEDYSGIPSYSNRTVVDKEDPSKTDYHFNIAGKSYKPDMSKAVDTDIMFSEDDRVIITFHDTTNAPIPVGTGVKSDKYLKKYFYSKPKEGDRRGIGFAHFYEDPKLIGRDQIVPYFTTDGIGEYAEDYGEFRRGMVTEQAIGGVFTEGQGGKTSPKYGEIFQFDNGGTVSSLWEEKTGLPWSQAKALGLTDGTYDANIALREKLNKGELNIKGGKKPVKQVNTEIKEAESFNEAFKVARKELGANRMFKWNGRVYGTNLAGEKFEPSKEDLQKFDMSDDYTKNRIKEENKKVESPYSSKEVVKVEPEWKDWESIKVAQKEQNKMSNSDKIIFTHKGKNDKYLIVDKINSRMHLYQGDNLIDTYEVGTGETPGDEQTKTVIRDGEVKWDEGNKQTGAGIFTVSGVSEYRNSPSFILKNEKGVEVPTVIHATLPQRDQLFGNENVEDNRMSYGCINGVCSDMNELYSHGIDEGTKVYVLPEDKGNDFKVENGKLNFRSSNPNVNKSVNTLNYIPIIPEVDFSKITLNSNDNVLLDLDIEGNSNKHQKERVNTYVKAISDNKKNIMKLAKVNGDVYNEIAKMSFGILGAESDYAAKYNDLQNYTKGVGKKLTGALGGPDYQFEYDFRKGSEDIQDYSLGMTQIAWKNLDKVEKKLLEDLGVYRISQLTDPKYAAIATTALLAHRYNNRSFDVAGEKTRITEDNMWELLPRTWNKAGNYPQRVKSNAEALSIKQLNDPEKLKRIKDAEKEAERFADKYIKTRDVSVKESGTITNKKELEKVKARKKLQTFVDEKPKEGLFKNDPFYEEKRGALIKAYGLDDNKPTESKTHLSMARRDPNISFTDYRNLQNTNSVRRFEDGGEYDLTEEEIQTLRDGGYKIDYLD